MAFPLKVIIAGGDMSDTYNTDKYIYKGSPFVMEITEPMVDGAIEYMKKGSDADYVVAACVSEYSEAHCTGLDRDERIKQFNSTHAELQQYIHGFLTPLNLARLGHDMILYVASNFLS